MIKTAMLISVFISFCFSAEVEIPRSMADKGKYYLITVQKIDNFVQTIHKRVGQTSLGFSKTKIDCKNMRYQDLGYGEDNLGNLKDYTSGVQWINLVPGSSKSDLVNFVCSKYK